MITRSFPPICICHFKVTRQEQRLARQRKQRLRNPSTQLAGCNNSVNEVKTQAAKVTTNHYHENEAR